MKLCHILAALLCVLTACSRNKPSANVQSVPPQAGGLYSLNDGEGGFRIGKIVAVEDDLVFTHLFSERWISRPSLEKARQTTRPAAIAFSTPTFVGMQPVHLENASVSPEELEAYETWKKSKQDVF